MGVRLDQSWHKRIAVAINHKTIRLLHYLVGSDDPLNDLTSRDNAS